MISFSQVPTGYPFLTLIHWEMASSQIFSHHLFSDQDETDQPVVLDPPPWRQEKYLLLSASQEPLPVAIDPLGNGPQRQGSTTELADL